MEWIKRGNEVCAESYNRTHKSTWMGANKNVNYNYERAVNFLVIESTQVAARVTRGEKSF